MKLTLEAVFHEATVIDFDFSEWDKRLRLVVISTSVRDPREVPPILNVDFIDVRELAMKFLHIGIRVEGHIQWNVMQADVTEEGRWKRIRLTNLGPPSPELIVECRKVEFSELAAETIDEISSTWRLPYQALAARPGIEELARTRRGRGPRVASERVPNTSKRRPSPSQAPRRSAKARR